MYHYQLWYCMMLQHGVRNARTLSWGPWVKSLSHPLLFHNHLHDFLPDDKQALTEAYRKYVTQNQ